MTPANREHPNPDVHSVSRHDAQNVAASPHLTQHIPGSAFLGAEHAHLSA
jgi:hypothetical protein